MLENITNEKAQNTFILSESDELSYKSSDKEKKRRKISAEKPSSA
ncbi:hypothetical protein AVEN_218889-1, partial [Araneus ventricosus]